MSVAARARRNRSLRLATLPVEPPARLAEGPLERCGLEDRFHDYVLTEYEPAASPVGKLRSVNLLMESFALMGLERAGQAVVEAIRTQLGPFRTVWGIKQIPGKSELGWELYFYDFQRAHADLSIASVTRILEPLVAVTGTEPHPLPWHMFSVELGRPQLTAQARAAVDIYIDMRSYKATEAGLAFENVYTFHDARTEINEVIHRLRSCVHFDPKVDGLHQLMPPHLFTCRRICVANKRAADAIYFSRTPTSSLLRFLRENKWPDALTRWVAGRGEELNHLLWDVGMDFRSLEGRATPVKTGIYGTF